MQIGRLRHRVTLQSKTSTPNALGEDTVAWTDQATVYAAVEPLRGREYFDAEQRQAEINTRVIIRARPDVTPMMRLLFGARVFEIESVINVAERDREMQLMCREVV